ncbi:MAG: hypothetical protein JSU88_05970 [Nitrospinaceae bacterium]|nr:MAG: hypothetical protein JSU88_05970 [Nitrospinaceae bacterium]
MRLLPFLLTLSLTTGAYATPAASGKASQTLAALLQKKSELEKQHGVATLECFPFIKNIGFDEDQPPLIEKCLQGLRTLQSALASLTGQHYRVLGISDRFLRTGGFQTALVPWNASAEEMTRQLADTPSKAEQERFIEKIHRIKQKITLAWPVTDLHCTMEISNEQCLAGYKNLARAQPPGPGDKVLWRQVVITHSGASRNDPYDLALAFNETPETMRAELLRNLHDEWNQRRRMYEALEEETLKPLRKKLMLANFFCAPDLSHEECAKGAASLLAASDALKEQYWGRVILDRHNTFIEDDFNVTLRYDLSAEAIATRFARRPTRQEATKGSVLAEKLEARTKNNPSGLRAVCDLEGLSSRQCAGAFQTFIAFVKKNRDYRVALPWTDVMFIDGGKLKRVNFALNSKSRNTYIYVHAESSLEEMETVLLRHRQKGDKD